MFEAYLSNSFGDVYTIDADGQDLTHVMSKNRQVGSADLVWSPDGKKVLFLSAHEVERGFGIGLAAMDPDRTDRHFISPDPQEMHQPDWESVP